MTFPTFSPSRGPSFPYSEPRSILTDGVKMHKGYTETRARTLRPLRSARLNWKSVPEDLRDYILSFFDGLSGGRGPFYWSPINKTPSPSGITPELAQVAGGALSERTIYVVYTWYDSVSGETKQSARSSMVVSANYYLRVTIPCPFPAHVGGWRVYAHESSGSECLQATVTTSRSWTQSAALSTGTATPPGTNTLTPALKWILAGEIACNKTHSNRWQISLELQEYIL